MRILTIIVIVLVHAITGYSQNGYDPVLKKQLDNVLYKDQQYRGLLNEYETMAKPKKDSLAKAYHIPVKNLEAYIWDLQTKSDKENLAFIEKIFKERGYPGKSMVGDEAGRAAFLVIQHSPKIKKYFPLIKQAGEKGELELQSVCMMEDRLLMNENKPQLYGSQMSYGHPYDSVTGRVTTQLYVCPVSYPAAINERRRANGFSQSVEEYAEEHGAIYDASLTMDKWEKLKNIIRNDWPDNTSEELKEKIKIARVISFPVVENDNSSFRYLQLVDSFSKRRDSSNTGKYLQLVDPYYLMYLGQTDNTLTLFLNKFALTTGDKQAYTQKFREVYNSQRTVAYDTFTNFYKRVQRLRHKLDSVAYKFEAKIELQLNKTDSIQAAYLHSYVFKNGWPSLSDGALYAANLAARDVAHYYDYLPLIKAAFMDNKVPLSLATKIERNKRFYRDYMFVKDNLKSPHGSFEGAAFLEPNAAITPIGKEAFKYIKEHCPVADVFFVHYLNGNNLEACYRCNNWQRALNSKTPWDLMDRITENCPLFRNQENGVHIGHYCLPNNATAKERELLFIIDQESSQSLKN